MALGALLAFAAALGAFALVARDGSDSVRRGRAPAVAATRPGAPTPERILALQAAISADGRPADTWSLLGGAYLQRALREGDAALYGPPGRGPEPALRLRPDDPARADPARGAGARPTRLPAACATRAGLGGRGPR